jgi:tetratricopeptide (TPR) repeat protein
MVVAHAKTTSTSLEAYRAYLAGVRALNSFDLDSANSSLGRAIAADSTFALAYYKLALLRGWRKQLGDTSDVHYSRMAARYASRLPERERMLVDAHLSLSEGIQASMTGETDAATRHLNDAQTKYGSLVRRDSADAEMWYGLGDAYFHEPTTGAERVSTMNQAMRAFQRTLALDSTLHLAYPHLLAMYTSPGNPNSGVVLRGDTLAVLDPALRAQLGEAAIDSVRRQARTRALTTAQHWVAHDPDANESNEALANAYLVAENFEAAAGALRSAVARPDVHAPEFPYRIATYELYAGRPKDALSSLRGAIRDHGIEPLRRYAGATRLMTLFHSGSVANYVGAPSLLDTLRDMALELDPQLPGAFMGGSGVPTSVFLDPWVALNKAALGMDFSGVRAPLDNVARNFDPGARGITAQARSSNMLLMLAAFVASRDTLYINAIRKWAPEETRTAPPPIAGLLAIIRGDTAAARAEAAKFGEPRPNSVASFFDPFLKAEVLAELGDLRGAIAVYESIETADLTGAAGVPDPRWAMYARSHLARGQMYEELGERAKAEAAYQQFVDLWREADPELQPQVRAAQAGLARLRDRPST